MSDWLNAIEIMLVWKVIAQWKLNNMLRPLRFSSQIWMVPINVCLSQTFETDRIFVHEKNFHARSRFGGHFIDVKFHSCDYVHRWKRPYYCQYLTNWISKMFNNSTKKCHSLNAILLNMKKNNIFIIFSSLYSRNT